MVVRYLAASRAALGRLPTLDHVVVERFFDDTGGMQLIVHAPFGGRINRALGPGAAQAVLRVVRFRAAGGGQRRRRAAVARPPAQLPARLGAPFPVVGQRGAGAAPGGAVVAHVRRPLAVEPQPGADRAALPGRPQEPGAHPAHGGRRPDGGGVPGPGRLPGERHRTDRDPRPPARPPDDARLPATRRWMSPACAPWSTGWRVGGRGDLP